MTDTIYLRSLRLLLWGLLLVSAVSSAQAQFVVPLCGAVGTPLKLELSSGILGTNTSWSGPADVSFSCTSCNVTFVSSNKVGTYRVQASPCCGILVEYDITFGADQDNDGVSTCTDCNDNDPTISRTITYYRDNDNDGFGNPNDRQVLCSSTAPAGYVAQDGDCNDNDNRFNPNTQWYWDPDADGYSTNFPYTGCTKPFNGLQPAHTIISTNGDCNQSDANINPGASEVCGNNVDDNCNGQTDEGCCTAQISGVTTSPPGCPGTSTGSATINGSCTTCSTVVYKITGRSAQSSPGFANLPAGNYTAEIYDPNDPQCKATRNFSIAPGVDQTNPTARCSTATVQLNASGSVSITAADVDNGSSDACGIASRSVFPNSFGCNEVGANNVELTLTDNNGNVARCTTTVTVEDHVLPTARCSTATVQLNASGSVSITTADVDNGSSDACGIASRSVFPNSFGCNEVGANNVELTLTDNNGNVARCTTTVTVEDHVLPTARCSTATVQLNASGSVSITAADVDNGSSDACGIASRLVFPNSFGCNEVGANNVELTLTDNNGNVARCTTTVTVADTVSPVARCKSATVYLDANGQATLAAGEVDNGSSDNCGVVNPSLSQTTFGCADVPSKTVSLTVRDNNGNEDRCSATVTVADTVPPTARCSTATVQLDASGNATVAAADIDNGSSDFCGIASRSVSPNSFRCNDIGPNAVVLTVTDNNGNVTRCSTTVTITGKPDLSVEPPAYVGCAGTTFFLNRYVSDENGLATNYSFYTQPPTVQAPIAQVPATSGRISTYDPVRVRPQASTTYWIIGTAPSGCTDTVTLSLNVSASQSLQVPAPITTTSGATVQLPPFGPAGMTFIWQNNNSAIGLGTFGFGNVPTFMASAVSSSTSGTITVYGIGGSCPTVPGSFTITVQPLASRLRGVPLAAPMVYPNPFGDVINVVWDAPLEHARAVEIFDPSGKRLLGRRIEGGQRALRIDTRQLAAGLYQVRIGSQVVKVVKR